MCSASMISDLLILFSDDDQLEFLFSTAFEWAKEAKRKVHWVRQFSLKRIPPLSPSVMAAPARLQRIIFHYGGQRCLEKAAELFTDVAVRKAHHSVIVETSGACISHPQALAAFLALASDYYRRNNEQVLIILPNKEDLMMVASLYSRNLQRLSPDGDRTSLIDTSILPPMKIIEME